MLNVAESGEKCTKRNEESISLDILHYFSFALSMLFWLRWALRSRERENAPTGKFQNERKTVEWFFVHVFIYLS